MPKISAISLAPSVRKVLLYFCRSLLTLFLSMTSLQLSFVTIPQSCSTPDVISATARSEMAYRYEALATFFSVRLCCDGDGGVRIFEIPPFNFQAHNYIDLIDWQQCSSLTEPPVMKSMSDAELDRLVRSNETTAVDFPRFPCHTQAVERCVKAVTEASKSVIGQQAGDGSIRARNVVRTVMPTFNTKCEYRTK